MTRRAAAAAAAAAETAVTTAAAAAAVAAAAATPDPAAHPCPTGAPWVPATGGQATPPAAVTKTGTVRPRRQRACRTWPAGQPHTSSVSQPAAPPPPPPPSPPSTPLPPTAPPPSCRQHNQTRPQAADGRGCLPRLTDRRVNGVVAASAERSARKQAAGGAGGWGRKWRPHGLDGAVGAAVPQRRVQRGAERDDGGGAGEEG